MWLFIDLFPNKLRPNLVGVLSEVNSGNSTFFFKNRAGPGGNLPGPNPLLDGLVSFGACLLGCSHNAAALGNGFDDCCLSIHKHNYMLVFLAMLDTLVLMQFFLAWFNAV